MGKYFGTDGIRGVVGEKLDARLAYRVGRAAAGMLAGGEKKTEVLIARDTRISGDMLEAALTAGLCSGGANVGQLGVLPTPAVAYLTKKSGFAMGIVISASHNPYEYNGIKMFGGDGFKLSDAQEARIEELIDTDVEPVNNADLGRVGRDSGYFTMDYIQFLASKSQERFSGKVAIDCANGAASMTARSLFTGLGFECEIISDSPDGMNINDNCGSTHLENLRSLVKSGGFDVGFAFDGDADRCLVVDELGNVMDGDMLLAVFARGMKDFGMLRGGGVVGTVVSNSGMDVFVQKCGFEFHRADVGDRHVLETMLETGCNLGGESSGHMIFLDDMTTGDGQLTAVKFLNVLAESGKTVSDLVGEIPRFPQVMPSYKLSGGAQERDAIMAHPRLLEEVKKHQELLKGEGRVLIRPSGTEAVIRVLVEAKTERRAAEIAEDFIDLMKSL